MGGFRKATKHESRLRLALSGPSGSGKTYTALRIATALSDKVAVIDTERGSASKYADEFEFDVLEPESFHPQVYIDAIRNAEQDGYEVLIIDSLSHAWVGKDGELELVDRVQQRSRSSNSFAAWREVTPLHNALVDAMLTSRCHIIATMRAKTAYSMDQDERGKTQVRKLGMEPIMRDGIEYEFDVHAMMDMSNTMLVMKSRCKALTGAVIQHPGADVAEILRDWLSGEPVPEQTTSHPSSQSGGGAGETTRPPTADPVDWKAVAKGFTQAELPKALLEACRTYWTAKGLNQDEVREAFRLVRDDYRADPDQCLADMCDLARKATAKEATE
jgi:Cdc6-like AAA superfamily ATPase